MRDFKFSEADLEANRQGRLSEAQKADLAAKGRKIFTSCSTAGLSIVGIGVLFFVMLSLLNATQVTICPNPLIFIIAAVVAGAACVSFGISTFFYTRRSTGQDTVVALTGPITLEKQVRSAKYVTTILRLGDQRFTIPADAYDHLTDGVSYTVYTRPNSLQILSIEPASSAR